VVATRNWLGNKVSKQWVTVGHSQGGQEALGTAQYAVRANLDYKGTVAVTPASQLSLILNASQLSVTDEPLPTQQIPVYASLNTFTALIAAGLRNSNPTLDYSQVFKVPTDGVTRQAESICSSQLVDKFEGVMGQYGAVNGSLKNYPRTTDTFMSLPAVKTFLGKDS
jgi:pimeloyl-ACP methyl ester carboxylesterase